MYKLHVSDRNYTSCKIYKTKTLETVDSSISPYKHKLFDQDIFDIVDDCAVIVHSSTQGAKHISGVLVLEGNKTYGKKGKRFIYRCIPDDRRLPEFLIPYANKIVFQKKVYNKYVIFQFLNWKGKHPTGMLVQILGDVTELGNFYEYQLYCKSLYASIQTFTKDTMRVLREKSTAYFVEQMSQNMQDRTNRCIFSIDPKASKDFDDAFGFHDDETNFYVGIYISNVALWLDVMGLWKSFSKRIATIYLPDRKRPMLPTILSDLLCSLQEHETRFAFTLDLTINKKTGEISEYNFCNTKIRLHKNFSYDNVEGFELYNKIFECVKQMNKTNRYVTNLRDSHDVVAYLMIVMNYISAKELRKFNTGIFRSMALNRAYAPPTNLPENIGRFLKTWNSMGGSYEPFSELKGHDMLELEAYVHITSPIRRLVDLLNMIELQSKLCLYKSTASSKFYDEWTTSVAFEYINKTMRAIRRVQNDCSLLHMCETNMKRREFKGFMFDRIKRNDGLFQYMVYLPELKMVNRVTMHEELENMSFGIFKLYVFMDEHRLKHKIRLEIKC